MITEEPDDEDDVSRFHPVLQAEVAAVLVWLLVLRACAWFDAVPQITEPPVTSPDTGAYVGYEGR